MTAYQANVMADQFFSSDKHQGYVHSLYRGAVNLTFPLADGELRLFTLLSDRTQILPDAALVPDRYLSLCADHGRASVSINQKGLSWQGTSIPPLVFHHLPELVWPKQNMTRNMDHFIRTVVLDTDISDCNATLNRLPDHYMNWLNEFAQAILKKAPCLVSRRFMDLVGAGSGLTPSCDDAMIGIMAFSYAGFASGFLEGGLACFRQMVRDVLHILLTQSLTTTISQKYLKCACRGLFAPVLNKLIQAFYSTDAKAWRESACQIRTIGHSSGSDMLSGFYIVLQSLLQMDFSGRSVRRV